MNLIYYKLDFKTDITRSCGDAGRICSLRALVSFIVRKEIEMNYTTKDFDFDLPEELIAQTPLKDRTSSRLLVVDKTTHSIKDKHFSDLLDELEEGDTLVVNNTRVLPARLYGTKEETGAHIEVLLLTNTEGDKWETLVKPAKRMKVGSVVSFGDGRLKATVIEELDQGGRIIEFSYEGYSSKYWNLLGKCLYHLILKSV